MRKFFFFIVALLFLFLVFQSRSTPVEAGCTANYDAYGVVTSCNLDTSDGCTACTISLSNDFCYCSSSVSGSPYITPTSIPTGGEGYLSPTPAATPGATCTSTAWCQDNVCGGYPDPDLCSSVCVEGKCWATYDAGEPTPVGGACQNWGPCEGDTRFCQDPGSSQYEIGCSTPGPTGGGGGGGFPTPTSGGGGFPTLTPTRTPTPTPTPTPGPGPWIKLKDSSHVSLTSLYNFIPAAPITAYDADDTAQAFYIVGVAGVVGAPSVNITGLNPNAKTGAPEYKANYTPTEYGMSPSNFLLYTQSRKEYEVISALTEITQDGIYVWQGANPLPINDSTKAGFDNYNIVLIVDGQVNVNTAQFAPAKSVAILAQTINFTDVVTEANALFIANDVLTGTTTNLGLKINGNLIAQSSLSNQRQWTDPKKASLFIVFKPSLYLDLLPYLTVVSYEWKQLQ